MSPGVAIADLCEVNPKHPAGIDPEELVAFVGMADLDDVTAAAEDTERRAFGDVAKGYTPFRNGDVLMAKITPCFENCKIGQAFTTTDIAAGSTEFHVMRPRERLHDRYLLHFLRQPWVLELGELRMTGSGGQRRVPERLLNELKIPLPPIEEQRRIAAVLDAADELRTKRRQALAKLDTLTQAIFIDLFGDPGNAGQWEPQRFGDLLEQDLRNGVSPSKSGKVQAEVLTLSAITGDAFDATAVKTSTFAKPHAREKVVSASDFLICRGNGNLALVGMGRRPTTDMSDVAFPDTMIAARWDRSRLAPRYLESAWNGVAVRTQIERLARTTNGTHKVNQDMLEAVELPCPPVDLQREFDARVDSLAEHRSAQQESQESLDTLFASLQQRAFAGEL